MPPEKLGRYEIVRELGHGAMGVVYEATDPTIGRRVALKCIRFDGIGTTADEAARRFKNEARAAGGLNHPNLVTVYDAGEDSGNLYLAMEFIEGSNLDELLRRQRRLSTEKATEIVGHVCAGLDFAHSKGIIHRDIKPANVMLGPHGMVKITDFGIARAGEVMTMTGQVVGTPNYMSPEQVLGKTIDGRSDLFSVGVMLYEMITGERPFEGQSITTIMYKIVHETPIPPRKLDSSIHPGLSAVIEKSLAKSPEERYQTGAELTRALENYQSVQPPRSGPFDVATQEIAVPAELRASGPTVAAGIPSVALPPRHEDKPASRFEFLRSRRKRLVAVAFALSVIFLARSKRHDSDDQKPAAQENTSTAVSSPAPPPAVPEKPEAASPDTGSESESTSPAVPALNRRENANDNKQTALLSVNSSPPGAQIEVDGNSSGKTTPAQLQLPRGQHSVSVRLNGFMPASASFRVKGGEEIEYSPQLSVAMPNIAIPNVGMPDLSKLQELGKAGQRQGAFWQKWAAQQQNAGPQLVITSSPLGARVIVDGKDTEQTTPATISVQPGTYHVRLELDGFEPVEHDVKVKEHRPGVWNPMLKHGKSQE